ncbi:MAG: radical SAM protein, partial [Minisyncoccia bacterium]
HCNNDNLRIGAQSGSQRILDLIGRGHSVEDVERAVSLAVKNGFNVNVDLIFGLPGEDTGDREKTFCLMEKLIEMGATIHAHAFMPLPGTPFSHQEPAVLDADTRKRLKKLEAEKKIYGSWENQIYG